MERKRRQTRVHRPESNIRLVCVPESALGKEQVPLQLVISSPVNGKEQIENVDKDAAPAPSYWADTVTSQSDG